MTKRAAASSGAGRSRSRHACWSAPAMIAVESASVPSQSKTSSRNSRGMESLSIADARLHFVKASDESREIRRQRRLDGQHSIFGRMRQRQSPGVQEHPLQALFRKRLVPGEVAVLVVARQRKSEMRQMHADLMSAPGRKLGF